LANWVNEFRFQARHIQQNRIIGLQDGEDSMGWDVDSTFSAEESGWSDRVRATIPRIEEDEMVLLRRMEKKLDFVEGATGVRSEEGRRDEIFGGRGSGGMGTGGEDVASEAEERGFVGGVDDTGRKDSGDVGKGKGNGRDGG
jgi:hypothetical protein